MLARRHGCHLISRAASLLARSGLQVAVPTGINDISGTILIGADRSSLRDEELRILDAFGALLSPGGLMAWSPSQASPVA
jgi:hypothetical protein